MSAFNAIGSAVLSKLASGTALTSLLYGGTAGSANSIYSIIPPLDAHYDYVVFNVQSGGENNDTQHRVKDVTLQVRAYSQTSARAGSIDAQCDALLHQGSLNVSGWVTLWQVRTQDIELVEYDEGDRPIYTRGGLYDVKIEKT
jgi:hypothetical protein